MVWDDAERVEEGEIDKEGICRIPFVRDFFRLYVNAYDLFKRGELCNPVKFGFRRIGRPLLL